MSLSQKVIVGGAVVIFVIGVGWALQYVSNTDLHLGKGNSAMMNVAIDEKGTVAPSRIDKESSQSDLEQNGASDLKQPVTATDTATIESKTQAEQTLLEIERSFGEIEADISATE